MKGVVYDLKLLNTERLVIAIQHRELMQEGRSV